MEASEWQIKWTDSLSVGIPEIDAEHRLFIARVNDVNRAIVNLENKGIVERLMELMLIEAARHFRNEIQLLKARQFPDTAEHVKKHDQLSDRLDCLIDDFRQDDPSFLWAMKGLRIKQLLVEHLLQEDMKFKEYFAQSSA